MTERQRIKAALEAEKAPTFEVFAEWAGISIGYLSKILNARQGMSKDVAKGVARAAGKLKPAVRVKWWELLEQSDKREDYKPNRRRKARVEARDALAPTA